ncbi:unnamed protein product [Sphenostylis stenocarpa]|uniref:Uncharacterized protein n=1 Tax=Sphenostylis stenocarpa TaxID=92480 RepID=A0AA86VHW8_9FABA|nr:unnamed protein product [Sphenostylis stenocarpa]
MMIEQKIIDNLLLLPFFSLRDQAQVEQLLRYIIEEPPEDAENKRAFKYAAVVVCLMIRKTVPLMNYVQAHQNVFRQLVDLIGITSIMEVLVRLVGADDHVYHNFIDVMQWLAESNLLEMIIDKLNPSSPPEVHANAAETLCTITRNPSSTLAIKLSSPSYVAKVLDHALEDSQSKSSLVNSLSVCVSLLDPKRSAMSSPLFHSFRSQHMYEPPIPVNPDTIGAMLPKLSKLLMLLNVSSDEKVLPTTYGELRPPLGKHRLKIVEFIAVLLKTGNEVAENDLPTVVAAGKQAPRAGNIGHITRIVNKLVQLAHSRSLVLTCLQENSEWNEWQASVLQERNVVENVHRWACGRPTALQDRMRDSDDDDLHDRDYDVAALANNLSQAFRYKLYGNEDNEEERANLDRDDEDVYFDDDSAQVVISSLRLSDDQGSSLFTNSNWFAFQDDRIGDASGGTTSSEMMDEINLNGAANGGSSSDDEVVVGEDDELAENNLNGTSSSSTNINGIMTGSDSMNGDTLNFENKKASASHDLGFFRFEASDNEELFGDRPLPDWVGWGEPSDVQDTGSSMNPFVDHDDSSGNNLSTKPQIGNPNPSPPSNGDSVLSNRSLSPKDSIDGCVDTSQRSVAVPSLFEEDVEFVGVELEGTEKAMEHALKEGIVGEAGPLKRNMVSKVPPEKESSDEGGPGIKEFNNANYWRVDQEVAVLE